MLEFEAVCGVLSILPDAVVVIDMQQRIRYCNEVAESMFRYAPGELKGQRLTVLIPPRYRDAHVRHVAEFAKVGGKRLMSGRPILAGVTKSGEEVPISAALCTFHADESRFQVAIVRSQSAAASRFLQMLSAAETDALTELGNRRYIMRCLARISRSDISFSLLYIDLDGFKLLNDRYGHAFGDAVLQVVAKRLRLSLRRGDYCARMGGDEFVAVLEGLGDVSTLKTAAGKVAAQISQPMHIEDHTVNIGVSVGALACRGPRDEQEVLEKADRLMYQAKQMAGAEHVMVKDDNEA
jgi:diguanylate cyclase (GGDEF)-like protein/PAS domain S-box-containing protein